MHKRRAARPAAARPSGAKAAVAHATQLSSQALCVLLRTADPSLQDGHDERSLLLPELTLSLARPHELSSEEQDGLFALLETNMRALYEASHGGWDAAEKRREMYDPASRFLLLRRHGDAAGSGSTLSGFLLFRFDTERCAAQDPDGRAGGLVEVGYCYELQVDAASRGGGLGRQLMRHFETLALRAGMRKTMLTVFTSNEGARRFYRHVGYGEDAITPARTLGAGESVQDYDYEILSKPLAWRGSN